MTRDFTYIDDIVFGIQQAVAHAEDAAVYNLGRGRGENLMDMIAILERCLGRKALTNMLPMQLGMCRPRQRMFHLRAVGWL